MNVNKVRIIGKIAREVHFAGEKLPQFFFPLRLDVMLILT